MKASWIFIFLSAVGVFEAVYHAWLENAFTSPWSSVGESTYSSFFGVPYWVFGLVWFPLILVVGIWTTHLGRDNLRRQLLILLTVGNIFTGYLWFVDLLIIGAFTSAYVGLYVTNYALTGLVVAENWSNRAMREFAACTIIGIVVGVFFGVFGAAVLGISGGIFGAIGGYTSTK